MAQWESILMSSDSFDSKKEQLRNSKTEYHSKTRESNEIKDTCDLKKKTTTKTCDWEQLKKGESISKPRNISPMGFVFECAIC